MRAIAADAYSHCARRAALSLRLPYRMQDALANALQIAARFAQMIELHGQRILDVLVLAASALEDQLHLDLVVLPLLEVDHGSICAQVVAAIFSRQRIDRVGPQLAARGGLGHRSANRLLDGDLVHADRS